MVTLVSLPPGWLASADNQHNRTQEILGQDVSMQPSKCSTTTGLRTSPPYTELQHL